MIYNNNELRKIDQDQRQEEINNPNWINYIIMIKKSLKVEQDTYQ